MAGGLLDNLLEKNMGTVLRYLNTNSSITKSQERRVSKATSKYRKGLRKEQNMFDSEWKEYLEKNPGRKKFIDQLSNDDALDETARKKAIELYDQKTRKNAEDSFTHNKMRLKKKYSRRTGMDKSMIGGTSRVGGFLLGETARAGWGLTKLTGKHVALPVIDQTSRLAGRSLFNVLDAGESLIRGTYSAATSRPAKAMGKYAYETTKDTGKEIGQAAWNFGRFSNRHHNFVTGAASVGIGAALFSGTVSDVEEQKQENKMKMANTSLSTNGGGAFVTQQSPRVPESVQTHGADGELVFALHNLRNGG